MLCDPVVNLVKAIRADEAVSEFLNEISVLLYSTMAMRVRHCDGFRCSIGNWIGLKLKEEHAVPLQGTRKL